MKRVKFVVFQSKIIFVKSQIKLLRLWKILKNLLFIWIVTVISIQFFQLLHIFIRNDKIEDLTFN